MNFLSLPPEIISYIISYVDERTFATCYRICKLLNEICKWETNTQFFQYTTWFGPEEVNKKRNAIFYRRENEKQDRIKLNKKKYGN